MTQEAQPKVEIVRVTAEPLKSADNLKRVLASNLKSFASVLPSGLTPEKFCAIVMNAVASNPKLLHVSGLSLMREIKKAAEIGLEPNTALGLCWLIPEGGEAALRIGYKGLLTLCREHENLQSIYADCVYKGDEFRVEVGTDPKIVHIPNLSAPRPDENIIFAYAVAKLPSGEIEFAYLPRTEIDKIRSCAKTQNVWQRWYGEMAKKTALRRLTKTRRMSPVVELAQEIDNEDYDWDRLKTRPLQTPRQVIERRLEDPKVDPKLREDARAYREHAPPRSLGKALEAAGGRSKTDPESEFHEPERFDPMGVSSDEMLELSELDMFEEHEQSIADEAQGKARRQDPLAKLRNRVQALMHKNPVKAAQFTKSALVMNELELHNAEAYLTSQ